MARFGEAPVKKPGTRSRASKAKKAEKAKKADERAQARFGVVAFVRRWLKQHPDEKPYGAYKAAKDAFEAGDLKWPVPTLQSFYNWLKKADADSEAPAISAFKDKPRTGRPHKPWDERVLDQCRRLVDSGTHRSVAPLLQDLEEFAERRGLEPPTRAMVRGYLESVDLAVLVAGAHGRRAAVSDAVPHPTVPVDHTHEIWTLDETPLPLWARAFHPVNKVWVAVQLWGIFIGDNASRALVAALLLKPFKDNRTTYACLVARSGQRHCC
jgi:hypothetical protein